MALHTSFLSFWGEEAQQQAAPTQWYTTTNTSMFLSAGPFPALKEKKEKIDKISDEKFDGMEDKPLVKEIMPGAVKISGDAIKNRISQILSLK